MRVRISPGSPKIVTFSSSSRSSPLRTTLPTRYRFPSRTPLKVAVDLFAVNLCFTRLFRERTSDTLEDGGQRSRPERVEHVVDDNHRIFPLDKRLAHIVVLFCLCLEDPCHEFLAVGVPCDYIYRAVREPSETVASGILAIIEEFASTMQGSATIQPWLTQIVQGCPSAVQGHPSRIGR